MRSFKLNHKSRQDLALWALVLVGGVALVLGTGALRGHGALPGALQGLGQSPVTGLIVLLFLVALGLNLRNTVLLLREFKALPQDQGLFAEHCRYLRKAARGKGGVDQEFSLSLLENRLLRRESWVQLTANLLVTLGMVGTILGLTAAMQGLASALGSIESSLSLEATESASPIAGLTLALEGMSTAFLTTLAGAVLGGLLLKALSHFSANLIEALLDQIRLKASLEVVPQLERLIWKQEMADLAQAQHNVQAFMNSGRDIDQFLKSYTQGLVGASEQLTVLSQKLGDQVFTVKRDSPVEGQQRLEALLSRLEGAAVQQNQLLTRLFYAVCGLAGGGVGLMLLVQVWGG